MRHIFAAIGVAALALAGAAQAGGWAAVTLSSTPAGVGAGGVWDVEVTVLRHGVTPTDGATPSVVVRNTKTGAEHVYRAAPAGRVGVYEASVTFPDAGTWSYEVDDGLAATGYGVSQTTEFPDVTIGSGGGGTELVPIVPLAGTGLLGLAVGLAGLLVARRMRGPAPASR